MILPTLITVILCHVVWVSAVDNMLSITVVTVKVNTYYPRTGYEGPEEE
jgi:hypothetical protein